MGKCSDDIFLVACPQGNYLLHAPLLHFSALVNEAAAQEISRALDGAEMAGTSPAARGVLARLATAERWEVGPVEGTFAPEHLQLFVTNACNMRCRYCLACGGDDKPTYMTEEVCRLALDFYVDGLQRSGRRDLRVSYLGGEPLMAQKLLVFADGYGRKLARELGFSFESELTTNGLMSERQARWMAKSLSHVVVSMDGPAETHDRYRRDSRGHGTHSRVEQTVRVLEAEGAQYALCCSVDAETVGVLPAMVEFMIQQYHPKEVGFNPVLEQGRCSGYGIRSPDPDVFVRQAMRAARIACRHGVRVFMRNGNSELLVSDHCCSVARGACVVTCDGFLSQCCRAETRNTPGAGKFLIGRVDVEAGLVEIDYERVAEVRKRSLGHVSDCEFCFAKWNCGGGCRLFQKQAYCGQADGYLCQVAREMTRWSLLSKLGVPESTIEKWHSMEEHVSKRC